MFTISVLTLVLGGTDLILDRILDRVPELPRLADAGAHEGMVEAEDAPFGGVERDVLPVGETHRLDVFVAQDVVERDLPDPVQESGDEVLLEP